MFADTIIHNAKIATNGAPSFVEALSMQAVRSDPPALTARSCANVGRLPR
jgi:hypothetical protein